MTTTVNIFTTIVLAGAAVFLAANANSADLEVSIEGLRSAEGQARVALHRRGPSASFPDEDGPSPRYPDRPTQTASASSSPACLREIMP